jgi:hypothetical protein
MNNIASIRTKLENKSDFDWFVLMCDILKKMNKPTTNLFTEILGQEKPNPKNEIRGSKFLQPYDTRFNLIYISPNLLGDDLDKPLNFLGFNGNSFMLGLKDIQKKFSEFKIQKNTYDGGTQFFFYPIPDEYEFALEFWSEYENINEQAYGNLIFKEITFRFGNRLTKGRDGYGVKRD